MATHKSAEKLARQAVRTNERNSNAKSKVRTFEKKLRKAIVAKDVTTATTILKDFTSVVSKAAQKNVMHVKAASRKISRLSAQVSALGTK